MNKASINLCVQVFLDMRFSVHLGKYQGAQLLDHIVRLCFSLSMNE